jgi:DNA-directed RNA polymerase specialized sigma24 family protein
MKPNLENHIGLVHHMAYKAAQSCGLVHEFEDVLQEAWVAACDAIQRYNPEKAALSTYLGQAIYFRVLQFYGKQENLFPLPEYYDAADPMVSPAEWNIWKTELTDKQAAMVEYSFRCGFGSKTKIIQHFAKRWGYAAAKRVAGQVREKLQEVVG